jgi:glycerol-3-phosphate acyltransferase PlsY
VIGYLVMVPVAYLLGSLPFGLILGWAVKRVDVRDYGSGKTGMTNVLRTVGPRTAVMVLLLDMGKSILSVTLARIFFDSSGVDVAAAVSALAGHNWPVFVGFRGGRGTAPGWGGLIILSPLAGLIATLVGAPAIAVSRYVSLGSILGTLSGVITLIVLAVMGRAPLEYIWFGAIGGGIVVGLHKDNIQRLIRGQERKIGQPAEGVQAQTTARQDKGAQWPKSV